MPLPSDYTKLPGSREQYYTRRGNGQIDIIVRREYDKLRKDPTYTPKIGAILPKGATPHEVELGRGGRKGPRVARPEAPAAPTPPEAPVVADPASPPTLTEEITIYDKARTIHHTFDVTYDWESNQLLATLLDIAFSTPGNRWFMTITYSDDAEDNPYAEEQLQHIQTPVVKKGNYNALFEALEELLKRYRPALIHSITVTVVEDIPR